MKTVSFVSKKGGVGKTTSAIHFAYWLAINGYAVVLVDDDNNRTATNWAERAESNPKFDVPFKIVSFRAMSKAIGGADYVVIDSQASHTDDDLKDFAEDCNLVIIPTKADISSARAATETADAIVNSNGQYKILIADAPGYNKNAKELRDDLVESGYSVFAKAIRRGEGVNHAALNGNTLAQMTGKYKMPWRDYETVFSEISELIA
ncbi:MAG: chromosome partitioning protein ParA [Leptolyngbya foveolarum]|uniref:Chromosome partitioning protein ParA n=1 Tax=Leptolyngbya foveolarum TaxID=47253 RepID=A0A2W4UMH5_9CYAN|nr:MAG: chromosome partitioning protein ParA [Leptolyngbya foveolarum]